MNPIGTPENPCTLQNSRQGDRGWKHCLCSRCARVKVCSPEHDFYETADGLVCEPCTLKGYKVQVIDLRTRKNYA